MEQTKQKPLCQKKEFSKNGGQYSTDKVDKALTEAGKDGLYRRGGPINGDTIYYRGGRLVYHNPPGKWETIENK